MQGLMFPCFSLMNTILPCSIFAWRGCSQDSNLSTCPWQPETFYHCTRRWPLMNAFKYFRKGACTYMHNYQKQKRNRHIGGGGVHFLFLLWLISAPFFCDLWLRFCFLFRWMGEFFGSVWSRADKRCGIKWFFGASVMGILSRADSSQDWLE